MSADRKILRQDEQALRQTAICALAIISQAQ
jgi:hypothetical protein